MTTTEDFKRISSGNRQADEILKGGFPANSINIIMGQPGTGKSIFAQQLVFHNAGGDRPILYLTTMSEPMAKMITYLQHFSFYDEDKLGTEVMYEDLGPLLKKDGVKGLSPYVKNLIHTQSPKMIVIDSFKALHDLLPSTTEMRELLYELTGMFTAFETTVFLIGEYTEKNGKVLPEFAVADGILQFMRNPLSTHDERFMRVLKLRGSSYSEGVHAFRIRSTGLEIFPRLVTPQVPDDYEIDPIYVSTGVNGLDKMLGGGFWKGSTTLLAGPTGAGKTTLALQFAMDGVSKGEPTLYVNFQENPQQLARAVRALGGNLADLKANGLHLMYTSPVELQIDSLVGSIYRTMVDHKISRIVIDALGDLAAAASDPIRMHDFLYSLSQHFTVNHVTSVLTYESAGGPTGGATDQSPARFSYMSDNIVVLNLDMQQDRVRRTLAIMKARASAHDMSVREMEITGDGVKLK